MTVKRDLKRRVRERQARTGESYMTALRHVEGPVHEPVEERRAFPVVELVDVSEIAAPLGYKLRVTVASSVVDRVDVAATLTRFRDLLLATTRDHQLELMRDVVLRGERPLSRFDRERVHQEWYDVRRFLERARAGLGGVSDSGKLLAMMVDSKAGPMMTLFHLALRVELLNIKREPTLGLSEVPPPAPGRDWEVIPW
jgi:hypothetical protein